MQFGKVTNPSSVDFTLPKDHPTVKQLLDRNKRDADLPNIYVGCAKWNKNDLKNFYPKGVKDELAYYAAQFNAIEFNASFYRFFPPEQYAKWSNKTSEHFRFFPKIHQNISHFNQLREVQQWIVPYVDAVVALDEKLGTVFLQLHQNFDTKHIDRIQVFVEQWPSHIPLAVEFRHASWHTNEVVVQTLGELFEQNNVSHIITDTAGRRDLLHMRLTNATAFVRYVGANHTSDYSRLDDWIVRLNEWQKMGLQNIYFFIHQNMEEESPLLAAYFIKKLNQAMGCQLKIPQVVNQQQRLF